MTQPLIVDCYQGDLDGRPNWSLLANLGPPYHGAIIKATEGTWYAPDWFALNWKQLRHVAPERYGKDWFRGAYHYLDFATDGARQADWYLHAIEHAGGWDEGDLLPVVDVELGGDKAPNRKASGQQITDCTTAFAERVTFHTGRKVVLYCNGAEMSEKDVVGRMGCSYLWIARYTPTLPARVYMRIGWQPDELLMWQHSGDGLSFLAGYPGSPPGFGKCDLSVLVKDGGLDWLRANLFAEKPVP